MNANPWKVGSISVVLPTYRESGSLRQVVDGFNATGLVDEVIVVNNNAEPGTSECLRGSGAVEVFERKQGYGHAIQAGLNAAKSEYLVICEPDGTFLPRDLVKLVAYAGDFDYVLGTRTSQTLIWRGANMRGLLRWGNWAEAKIIEVLFNTTNLTDVGCTYRLLHRKVYEGLRGGIATGDSDFGLVFTLSIIRKGFTFIEVPVNYCPRVGTSSVTGSLIKAVGLGIKMLFQIIRHRFS